MIFGLFFTIPRLAEFTLISYDITSVKVQSRKATGAPTWIGLIDF
jgi:hypothetical protein